MHSGPCLALVNPSAVLLTTTYILPEAQSDLWHESLKPKMSSLAAQKCRARGAEVFPALCLLPMLLLPKCHTAACSCEAERCAVESSSCEVMLHMTTAKYVRKLS